MHLYPYNVAFMTDWAVTQTTEESPLKANTVMRLYDSVIIL
jgi:hypothetical protein